MLTFAYYLLKVSLCSGLLYGYYLFALRNKKFHQYNRFYLLLNVIISWIIPVAKIKFWSGTVQHEIPAIRLLKVVATRDTIAEESLKSWFGALDYTTSAFAVFLLISAVLFTWLISGIIRIIILIRSNPDKSWNNINFIFTEAKGTPFSFFTYIFWNRNIGLQTEEGKYILQHELAHVRERHSLDKLFLHMVLIIGWLNPFFWIIRKELNMIHEFIADEKAISDGDTASFSAMLLKAAFPHHSFIPANSFFHSPVKRRLVMFTNSKKTSYSYLRRLMILPLLSFVIVFFSFKLKGQNLDKLSNSSANVSAIKFENVVITNEISKSNITIDKGDTTIKIKIAPGQVFKTITNEQINIKTDNIDTPAMLKALIVVDGEQKNSQSFNLKNLPAEKILSMTVLKNKSATDKYGQKGADGVIEIITKDFAVVSAKESQGSKNEGLKTNISAFVNNSDTIEAKFPGGEMEWKKYLEKNLDANVPVKDKAPKGDYTVKLEFVVTETGEIRDIAATQIPARCPACATEAVKVIKKGPKWDPMIIRGEKATSRLRQFISFQVEKN